MLLGVYSPPFAFSCLSYKSTQSSTQVFFILKPVPWELISKLRITSNTPQFKVLHSPLRVFSSVCWTLSLLKGFQIISSPILKLNRSSGTWPAVCFWGFLIPVATAAAGFSEKSSVGTHFLRLFKDSGRLFNCLEYTVSAFLHWVTSSGLSSMIVTIELEVIFTVQSMHGHQSGSPKQ